MTMSHFITSSLFLLGALMGSAACPTCLEVYSIQLFTYLGPDVEAHVKVTPLPSDCVTVVTGQWTEPDGNYVVSSSIASGTRRRAEFPLYSDQAGDFEFKVLDINCGNTYSYHGNDSATITLGNTPAPSESPVPGPGGCTNCMSISSIAMSQKGKKIYATLTVQDANGNPVDGAAITAYWVQSVPSTAEVTYTSEYVGGTSNRKGNAVFSYPENGSGMYTIQIVMVTSPTGEEQNVAVEDSIAI